MAALSILDATATQRLRSTLEALEGVARAVVDDAADTLCIVCEPDAETEPLDLAVRQALFAQGIDPRSLTIEIVVRPGRGPRRRVRFIRAERIHHDAGLLGVRVTLEWQGREVVGEAVGETGLAIEPRTAATAAIDAVERLVGRGVGLRLIGVKQVRAFDADLIITSIHRTGPPAQRYVGAVLASTDSINGATVSVLHALNRMMGNFLLTTD